MEDVRDLQLQIDESARRNENLLLEHFELKLENNRLHSKLKESQKVENANAEKNCSPNKSLCSRRRSSSNSIQTLETCPIVTEDIQDNEIVRNYNRKNSKKRIQKLDQCDKQLSRFTRDQKKETSNECLKYSQSMNKLEITETTRIHKKGRHKESEKRINRKQQQVIIGDSMVKNMQSNKNTDFQRNVNQRC